MKARLALSEIFAGYELRGERMDNQTAAALAAVQSVFDRPELRVELDFAPGQIQYVNNRATGHARTEFVDHPEPERRRHLVRLWLRDRRPARAIAVGARRAGGAQRRERRTLPWRGFGPIPRSGGAGTPTRGCRRSIAIRYRVFLDGRPARRRGRDGYRMNDA